MGAKVTDIQSAPADITVTDRRGRVLTLKKPNVIAQYQLVRMLGGDVSANQTYLSMVMPILYLHAIDGQVANFSNQREMESIIQELDEEGLEALSEGIKANFARDSENKAEAIKKP